MTVNDYYKYYFSSTEIEGSSERIEAKNELVYSLLEPYLKAAAPVLELGVGKGWFARACIGHGHPYHGIEANGEQCRELEAQGIDVTCARVPPVPAGGESGEGEYGDGGYGLIYSAHLIEHLAGGEMVHELLADCPRLLAPGGVLALLFPDAMAMGNHFWNCDYTHTWPTTERRVAQALADAGFQVREGHKLCGHYTGAMRIAARAGSRPLVLRTAQMLARNPERRDLFYRGWMYLQQDVLLIATPRTG
ncbi:MAG: class I SAM-dependent methyltransferase [Actinobacteria bacterium]|nr:class I SAM-dependent methyltransferase [Actinomycetota bacterium]